MKRVCPVSCSDMKSAPRRKISCIDIDEFFCPIWFEQAECETNESVKKYCPLSCGRCENTDNTAHNKKRGTRDTGSAEKSKSRTKEKKSCEDDHENCRGWAVRLFFAAFS